MSKNYEQEIEAMQRLINYGTKENVNEGRNSGSIVEYKTKAADGKTYGIVRECNKFYIKVAPKKDTEILSEDFDYIGGFNNKRFNEYTTYTMASKQLDLKIKSINEACNAKVETSQFAQTQPSEWQINETKEMRQEIERMNQITQNVHGILTEGTNFTPAHTIPEAPGKANVSDKDVSNPFVETSVANGGEMKNGTTNYEKAGGPFSQGGTVTNADMQSDKKPKGKGEDTYNQKPKFGPKFDKNTVADKHPGGGKVTRADESVKRTVKLTEEQVLAWNRASKDYMDKSHGTEIGHGGDPFDEEVHPEKENDRNINTEYHVNEEVAMHATDNQNKPTPGTGDAQSKPEPFDDKVEVVYETEISDETMLNDAEGDGSFLENEDSPEDVIELDVDRIGFEDDEEEPDEDSAYKVDGIERDPAFGKVKSIYDIMDDDYNPYLDLNSKRRSGRRVNEGTVLDDFGKHPAYQKQVMTLPPNKEIDRWGRDWNDKSTKGSEPFGTKIGSSAPFTEEVIEMLTDKVIRRLNIGSKKKD